MTVVRIDARIVWHALRQLNAVGFKGFQLAWVIGHQFKLLNTKVIKHRAAHAVFTLVGGKTEAFIGFYRICALVLQRVGADFIQQANAAPFLAQVQQHAPPFGGNRTQRGF